SASVASPTRLNASRYRRWLCCLMICSNAIAPGALAGGWLGERREGSRRGSVTGVEKGSSMRSKNRPGRRVPGCRTAPPCSLHFVASHEPRSPNLGRADDGLDGPALPVLPAPVLSATPALHRDDRRASGGQGRPSLPA